MIEAIFNTDDTEPAIVDSMMRGAINPEGTTEGSGVRGFYCKDRG